MYNLKRDGPESTKSDGVRNGSRQYEYYFGGELMASECKIYIYFSSFHSLCATLKGENPRRILPIF